MITLIKSALLDLKRQPVLGIVSVAGSALAIYLIMIVVMLQDVKTAPIAPESNRDRFLHCTYGSFKGFNDNQSWYNSPYSYKFVREYFYPLTEPEAVTAYSIICNESAASLPGHPTVGVDCRTTDANYWSVFDFTFLSGAPYTQADVDAGIPLAVITESAARRVFGSTDVVGREFNLDYSPVRVCGVVRDVSSITSKAYAEMWLPVTYRSYDMNDFSGFLSVTMLAPSVSKKDAVRHEYIRMMESVETKTGNMKIEVMNRPYDQWTETCSEVWANMDPDVDTARRNRLLTYLVLFIVPAVNLSEMTRSRMRRRYAEIGVRRAFGCNRMGVIRSVFAENLVLTLIAGAIGLLLAILTCIIFDSELFFQQQAGSLAVSSKVIISPSEILRWSTFGWALLACFLLNLLSTGIPAIRASRINIVNALSGYIRK